MGKANSFAKGKGEKQSSKTKTKTKTKTKDKKKEKKPATQTPPKSTVLASSKMATGDSAGDTSGDIVVKKPKLGRKEYEAELLRLQIELVKLSAWVKEKGLRVVVLFEGRDAAGKGGAIKRITESISPRLCRVVALSAPTERERGQWYFQRYVSQLPSAGEIVLFDRSWYNRAGVEQVMGFCSEVEYREFLRSAPEFERMLIRSGLILIKYWFSVSDEAQEKRFQERNHSPIKRWKLSPMDLQSRAKWAEYSRAKDEMFKHTDLQDTPWWVVHADDKKRARLNCVAHFVSMIPYEDLTPEPIDMPPRDTSSDYVRPPMAHQRFVPDVL